MIIVSACLAGENCRYNGKNYYIKEINDMVKKGLAVSVCPEVLGGLNIPRNPMEICFKNNETIVMDRYGNDHTVNFIDGANHCLKIAKDNNISTAILKSKSPSCGYGHIYDGTFTNKMVIGNGITVNKLIENGIKVYNENNYKELLK